MRASVTARIFLRAAIPVAALVLSRWAAALPANVEAVVGASIQPHPCHWSTIGYRSDIEGVTTGKLREHHEDFFRPDNAEAARAFVGASMGCARRDERGGLADRHGHLPQLPGGVHPPPRAFIRSTVNER